MNPTNEQVQQKFAEVMGIKNVYYNEQDGLSRNEALDILLDEGWRWVECEHCGGDGKWPLTNNKAHLNYGKTIQCRTCSGEGGKWEKG